MVAVIAQVITLGSQQVEELDGFAIAIGQKASQKVQNGLDVADRGLIGFVLGLTLPPTKIQSGSASR